MSDIFSSKKNTSTTDASTNTTVTDSSANAGTNSIAASGGATINIENLSDDVALGSLSGMRDVSVMAMRGANDLAALLQRENQDERESRNIANESNAALATNLAAMVSESKRDPDNQILTTIAKYGAWAVGGVVVLLALVFFFRSPTPRSK